jgi:hypothetical protein
MVVIHELRILLSPQKIFWSIKTTTASILQQIALLGLSDSISLRLAANIPQNLRFRLFDAIAKTLAICSSKTAQKNWQLVLWL